jgi:hypothetical protein
LILGRDTQKGSSVDGLRFGRRNAALLLVVFDVVVQYKTMTHSEEAKAPLTGKTPSLRLLTEIQHWTDGPFLYSTILSTC